jgi:hypothetical protein
MVPFPRKGCVLAAVCLFCGFESRAQSFTNGGFEIVTGTPIPAGTAMTLNPGDTWLTGWGAGGPAGAVTVQNGYAGEYFFGDLDGMTPWQGQQWAIFPDDSPGGSLSQTFATAVGAYCTVSFVGTYVYAADDPLLGVTVAASDGTVLSNNVYELSYREWTGFQLSFLTTTPTTTLTFTDASVDAEGADIGLDGVTLVTEPPGWPYIIRSPQSVTNAAGTQATFRASAGGSPSTVQWYLGTNAVAGATNATLAVIASEATAGSYTAVFSNSVGTNVSPAAILTVLQVVTSPLSQTVSTGTPVIFTASVNLSQTTVQWYFGSNLIPGATSPTLIVTAGNQTAGSYTAQFSDGSVMTTSAAALLTVLNIPFINGSFEVTSGEPIAPGDIQVGNVGDEWLAGWTFGGAANEIFAANGSFLEWGPVDGNQWIIFDSQNSPPPGVLSQTFSTVAGTNYVVTFAAMAVYYDGTPFKSLMVTAMASDGSILASNEVEPSVDWATNQLTFTAQTINTTLAFTDTSDPNYGPSVALDAVTMIAAGGGLPSVPPALTAMAVQPMPGSFVMQLAGQAGQSYIVQTSTNLTDWCPVSTNILTGPSVNITNTLLPGVTGQFWRAIPAP